MPMRNNLHFFWISLPLNYAYEGKHQLFSLMRRRAMFYVGMERYFSLFMSFSVSHNH
jgi:hypothetical protein